MTKKESYRGIEHVVPSSRPVRFFVDRLVDHYVEGPEIQEKENLEEARGMSQQEGTGIVFVGNHLSNADYPVLIKALRMSGFTNPSADTVAILGIRLYANLASRIGIRTAPHIKVFPPTETPKNEEEKRNAQAMNINALRAQKRVLRVGMNTLIYPQGGREPHEITRIPPPQISGFLDYGIVLPFGLVGTDQVLPMKKRIPKRASASIVFGEPFLGQDLKEQFNNLPRDERRAAMINEIMTRIAICLPPDYRGVYAGAVEKARGLSARDNNVAISISE